MDIKMKFIFFFVLNSLYLCEAQWTTWYNIDNPDGDGDFETLTRIQQNGGNVCTDGTSVGDSECRIVNIATIFVSANASSAPDNLTTACTTDGLLCENGRQTDGSCNNYEVRFLCQAGFSGQVQIIPGDYTLLYIALVLTIGGIIATLVLIGIVGWKIRTLTKGTDEKEFDMHLIQRVREKRMSAEILARRTSKIRVYTYENHLVDPPGMKLTIPDKPLRKFDDDGGVYDGTNSPTHNDKEEDYYNSFIYDRGIEVRVFGQYIKQKGHTDAFEKEFKELQKGLVHQKDIGSRPENKPKNRYLTVLPYDHSIVPLTPTDGMPNANYINANYIDSTENAKKYIAAQGPMTKTIRDFWLMVWQQQSGVIVMLTRFKEGSKIKCAWYCPEKDKTAKFGNFTISLQTHKIYNTFEHRTLLMENSNSGEKRTIEHLQYTAWYDHATPSHIHLIKFHRKMTQLKTPLPGPLIVHCSAGVGRTGTFIALDALLEQALQTNQVQVFNYVKLMRKDRMNMIQTLEQYIFMYHVLHEALLYNNSEKHRRDFLKEFKDEVKRLESNQKIVKEYKKLMDMKSIWWEEHTKEKGHKVKGLPIHLNGTEIESTMIPAYGMDGGFVLTKYSHTKTIEDFLHLIVNKNCRAVVAFSRSISDFIGKNLPDQDGEITHDGYSLKTLSQLRMSDANVISTTLEIHKEVSDRRLTCIVLRIHGEQEHLTPAEVVSLVGLLSTTREKDSKDPVLLISGNACHEGAKFIVVSNVFEDIKREGTVDIYNTVRQLQILNPKLISSLDHYTFCYKAVVELLLSDSDYVNT